MAFDKYLVLKASGGGGLGDCLKSVLTAAHYAALTGRKLYVDWSGGLYSDGSYNPFNQYFELRDVAVTHTLPRSEDVYPRRWRGRLNRSLHDVYTEDGWLTWDRQRTIQEYSFDLGCRDYSNDVLVMWEFDQMHKIAGAQKLDTLRDLVRKYLKPSEQIRQQCREFKDNQPGTRLGVHIRATHEFYANKGGQRLESYMRVVKAIMSSAGNHEHIFLATDNRDMEREFIRRFPNTICSPKKFAESGQPLHINVPGSERESVLQSALIDVLLLSDCPEILITPYSSFSEMAQIFSTDSTLIHLPRQSKLDKYRRLLGRLKRISSHD